MINTDSNFLQVSNLKTQTHSSEVHIPLSTVNPNLLLFCMGTKSDTRDKIETTNLKPAQLEESDALIAVNSPPISGANVRTSILDSTSFEKAHNSLQHCNLSLAETILLERAETIVNISARRTGPSFFSPFWACQAKAQELSQSIDSIVVDLYQGTTVGVNLDIEQSHWEGIPLTGTFLTIKAYPKSASNRYFLTTEGMARFGLPELTLPEIPSNLASDGAYLLRGIAQYLWSKLENVHPEQPHVAVEAEFEMPVRFCELQNPLFHSVEERYVPISLEVLDSKYETMLIVRPTSTFDDYYDWFLSIRETIVEHRLYIQQLAKSDSKNWQEQILAA